MNKDELIKHFIEWRDNDEHEKIVAAAIALPEESIDDEILSWLARAYIDIGEYKRAIAVLDSLRARMENDYKWHFMMGLALLRAAEDDECDDDDDLRRNILERAKVCLARGMNMNPPDDVLEQADWFMEEIEGQLEELNGPPENDYDGDVEAYEDEELDVLEDHIKEYYGEFPTVFHEITSKGIVCDIACIPPTEERNYFTLVTMGMGAHLMNIPEALSADEHGRAELLICLPPDWKLGENAEEWFWPISLLKDLAKLPLNSNTWLGWGHSVDHRNELASTTKFCASLLIYPEDVPDEAGYCVLPNGDRVNFFEVVPMYREEMNFKINNNTTALLERMKDVKHVVDVNRPNCCENEGGTPSGSRIIDSAKNHCRKIAEKNLPLGEISGCNHIAIFLRWCIERDLIAAEFFLNCPDEVKGVKDGTRTDLREFIVNFFGGNLEPFQFSYVGACFTDYYYNWDRDDPEHFYPSDVDDYAEHYFGTERYNSEEFQDEAYMFVPFDEAYYRGMSEYIERAYADFLPDFVKYCEDTDIENVKTAEDQLGLKIELPKYNEFTESYRSARYTAKSKGGSALPIILDPSAVLNNQDDIANLLLDAADPFLETVAIVHFPTAEPEDWASNQFENMGYYVIEPNERIISLQKCLADILGAVPAVFTYDNGNATLLIPLKNNAYMGFRKRLE